MTKTNPSMINPNNIFKKTNIKILNHFHYGLYFFCFIINKVLPAGTTILSSEIPFGGSLNMLNQPDREYQN